MVKIAPFDVEQWMDEYETTPGVLNIAETCASSISISQLSAFDINNSAGKGEPPIIDFSRPMTYGAIKGSENLRRNIAALYAEDYGAAIIQKHDSDTDTTPSSTSGSSSYLTSDNVLVTQGAIAANHLVFYTFVGPGDHVICVYPTYQQLYDVPRSLGAEVSLWKLRAEDGFLPDVKALETLVRENTKMIVFNNPNNPTGASTPTSLLSDIISIARRHDIIILSDEVYRPLYHSLPPSSSIPPSLLSPSLSPTPYTKILSTSSMSKSWALAGLRIGWIASHSGPLLTALAHARDYTTISVSQVDDQVASFALSSGVAPALLRRNVELARRNLRLLDEFVARHEGVCDWVRPTGGTTAFVRFFFFSKSGDGDGGKEKEGEKRTPVDDVEFCKDVLQKTKVMVVPGSLCFGNGDRNGDGGGGADAEADFRGYVRIGYVNSTEIVREALEKLSHYVRENLE